MSLDAETLRGALPEGGLFEGGWMLSPEPLCLTKAEGRFLRGLGHLLARFQEAADEIYRNSASGKLPPWIAELLDTGKPTWMIDVQRAAGLQSALPRVIRPDLLLGEGRFWMSELDAVPGGMGITAWLAEAYSSAGFDVLGGARGMIDGFSSVLGEGGRVLVSEEAADYRKELEWLVAAAGAGRSVVSAEEFSDTGHTVYRFFEWFDWEAVPTAKMLAERSAWGKVSMTPPCKPHLEDKLWLALLWTPALKSLWESRLRGSHLARLRDLVPFGWVVDPSPLPPQAALPKLGVHDWEEVMDFSQKERKLVLKISGFHETAWGSRGVHVGHDLSKTEWRERLEQALDDFDQQPWMMQEFGESRVIEHPVFDPDGTVRVMKGRVRLCPYYFTNAEGHTELGGCLATIVPADKKKIHGMKDGVLVPCVVEA